MALHYTPSRFYRHTKTGKVYREICRACDSTNARDGRPVIVYQDVETAQVFVRDVVEFFEVLERRADESVVQRFTPISTPND